MPVAVYRAGDAAPHGDEPDLAQTDPWQLADGVALSLGELAGIAPVTREEEIRLGRAVRAGDPLAALTLVEANLRLVVSIAARYRDRGVALTDLVQEGSLALVRAVTAFDGSPGPDFSTAVYWSVREAIRDAVAERGCPAPMPPATLAAIARLRAADRRLALELGRDPTEREVAQALGTSRRRLAILRRMAGPPAPPDAVVPDADRLLPVELLAARMRVDVHALLSVLRPRERRVLQLRYGLVDGRRRTPEEIGRRLGVTRQRVTRIETLALAKLRYAAGRPPLA